MNTKTILIRSLIALFAFSGVCFAFAISARSQPLGVMTFNIRYDEPRDGVNAWPNRKQKVADVILKYDADLVGIQEALLSQLKDLEMLFPDFGWCGVGRTDGTDTGEYSAIFYRRSRLKLLTCRTFWLSETPDKPGSMGWDAAFPRIVTWARFGDLRSKKKFFHFNTHFDHQGETARINSARLLLEQVSKIAGKKKTVVTGDFNATPESEIYKTMVFHGGNNATGLTDARTASETGHSGPLSTFNSFKELLPDRWIDYIFVGKDIRVLRHVAIGDRPDGLWPSDHLPVFAELSFDRKKNVR